MSAIRTERLANGNLLVSVPVRMDCRGNRRVIIVPEGKIADAGREAFLKAVARGRRWQRLLDNGTVAGICELGQKVGRDPSYVARIIRLANLAPAIIEKVAGGECPAGLPVDLARKSIPELWDEQMSLFFGGK